MVLLKKGGENMATNPPKGDGHRHGAVTDRSQVLNPKTFQRPIPAIRQIEKTPSETGAVHQADFFRQILDTEEGDSKRG